MERDLPRFSGMPECKYFSKDLINKICGTLPAVFLNQTILSISRVNGNKLNIEFPFLNKRNFPIINEELNNVVQITQGPIQLLVPLVFYPLGFDNPIGYFL